MSYSGHAGAFVVTNGLDLAVPIRMEDLACAVTDCTFGLARLNDELLSRASLDWGAWPGFVIAPGARGRRATLLHTESGLIAPAPCPLL